MANITFSNVCHVFYNHMINPKKATISRALLSFIIDDENVKDEKGNEYIIDRKEYYQFFEGQANVYPNIRTAPYSFVSVFKNIIDNFSDLFDSYINENEHENVATDLLELLKEDTSIDSEEKNEILNLDLNDPYEIAARIFIHSLNNPNKTSIEPIKPLLNEEVSPKELIEEVVDILGKLPKPIMIDIPTEISLAEMTYVSAIMEAFAEDAGVSIITQNELVSKEEYSRYKRQFNRYRREYYAAETIRESVKDTKLLNDGDYFEDLKNETYDSVIDKVDEPARTSYERMTKVLSHATTITLSSLLAKIPNWIEANEKKGLCHMLVNEERIKWKNE